VIGVGIGVWGVLSVVCEVWIVECRVLSCDLSTECAVLSLEGVVLFEK
jgi:hypothetical protein